MRDGGEKSPTIDCAPKLFIRAVYIFTLMHTSFSSHIASWPMPVTFELVMNPRHCGNTSLPWWLLVLHFYGIMVLTLM